MDLERNNLDTQLSLLKDVASNYKNIIYHFNEKNMRVLEVMKKAIKRDGNHKENDPVILEFSAEDWNNTLSILHILAYESKQNQLGILAESAVPDNKIKLEILQSLQKN